MRALVAFTRDGIVPLLGPKTSVGEFHHGAFYYFLLAPASALSNGDPVAVTGFLALLGIAAVALTWWFARAIGGSTAGAIAGLLLAVSPAAIDESTFIWNPNPIAFFAVLALAAAWKAHTGGTEGRRVLWWSLALGSAGAVTQLHVLGVVFLIAVLALCLLELRHDDRVALGLVGGMALIVLLFLPLLVNELQTGFQETRFVLAYLQTGDEGLGGGPVSALAFTLLRVVGWPLMGLVTDAPAAAAILLAVTVGLGAVGLVGARGLRATGLRWLVGILAWSTIALAFAAPSLQRVVAGLPNDHYHAFIDPIVVILIAVPAAGLLDRASAAWRETHHPGAGLAGIAIGAGVAALVAVAVVRMPPAVDPDGGWPAMRAAGARVAGFAAGRPVFLYGLPDFKLPDAIGFPIEFAGGEVADRTGVNGIPIDAGPIAIVCDRLFGTAIGQPCGGPAEDAYLAILTKMAFGPDIVPMAVGDRFDASPRTSISIYVSVTR